jgi:hypothetical protein
VNFREADRFNVDPYFEDVKPRPVPTLSIPERMAEFVTNFTPTPVKENVVTEDYESPFEIATKASIRHPVKRGVNGLATMEDIDELLMQEA